MLHILIIEDEELAAERLEILLKNINPDFTVMAVIDTIEDAVSWFKENESPDLAFFDIQLADGLSFKIFEEVEVECPLIFTTAYDEYALKAFKVNSIDYLLKPIDKQELENALMRYEQMKKQFVQSFFPQKLMNAMNSITNKRKYKQRFMVKAGAYITSVPVEEIAYFFTAHKTSWLKTFNGKKHALDLKLEEIEQHVDPAQFFRLNRQYLASFDGIKQVTSYTNSRLKVQLAQHEDDSQILISREKVGAFKAWLDS